METELSFSAPSGTNINNMDRIIFSYLIGGAKYQFFYQKNILKLYKKTRYMRVFYCLFYYLPNFRNLLKKWTV
jgi:hypothetical protein